MATSKEAQAVKSLNTAGGKRNRRFVFKTFSERINETEIDVFRSLAPLKAEPSGSSFFIDCLIQWRELNTAEDFITFYDEVMPLAQSLPLLIVHKELIFSKLHSRLHMKARLSLEPILRLTAELSRDLLGEFIQFLPKIVDTFLNLLNDGAEREPEIVEQIFTSWSYMMMYLQKYLTQDVCNLLKITRKLRYYPKDFVQEFMAEAMSFLLRNAPVEQLRKGIMKLLLEVARNPSQHRLHGASSVLWQTMRGTSSKFHSRARIVLLMLLSSSVLNIQDNNKKEPCGVDVVSTTFQRLCLELKHEELQLMWDCLYQEIDNCLINRSTAHLTHLLSILITTVSFQKGHKVCDNERLLKLCGLLIKTFMEHPIDDLSKDQLSQVGSRILDLILCILDGSHSLFAVSSVSEVAMDWASAFQPGIPGILMFLKELLQKDLTVLLAFQNNILSVCNNLMRTSKAEVIYLLLSLCEKLPLRAGSHIGSEAQSEELVLKISHFLQEEIRQWKLKINKLRYDELRCGELQDSEVSLIWGIVCCYPHFVNDNGAASFLIDLADELHHLCSAKDTEQDEKLSVVESGGNDHNLQSLIGACLRSFQKLSRPGKCEPAQTIKILDFAKEYKSSPHILSSVADYLDATYGAPVESSAMDVEKCSDLNIKDLTDIEEVYADNLLTPDKMIRVSTLRILGHYEYFATNRLKPCHLGENEVLSLLLLIEETPITLQNSRKFTLLVSKIQTELVTGRVSKFHIHIILTGIIGVLFNQFRDLNSCALDCLAVLLEKYSASVWDKFVTILERLQLELEKPLKADSDDQNGFPDLEPSDPVLNEENESSGIKAFKQDTHENQDHVASVSGEGHNYDCGEAPNEGRNTNRSMDSQELSELYHSYAHVNMSGRPFILVVPLLLQALQKIPTVVEARSRYIVPLFFKFLGFSDSIPLSVQSLSFNCGARDWKVILLEWLNLLKVLRNPRSYSHGQLLKEILVYRFLDDNDVEIQIKVLDCLLNWKDDFLLPYNKHLKNLMCSKMLREELTTWSLSKEACLIEDGHRKELVPYIIRVLMPKVRNLKTLASRKHASMSSRRAVIGFISQLDSSELPLFFALLIKPFQTENNGNEEVADRLLGGQEVTEDEFNTTDFLRFFSLQNILNLPWKKRCGFLHVVEDILAVFVFDNKRVKFLQLLTGCVGQILYSCYFSLFCTRENCRAWLGSDSISITEDGASFGSTKQLKELRTLCLKIISTFLHRYHDFEFNSEFWTSFFVSVKHLIDGFKDQGATSEKPNALFSCVLAMSQSASLVPLLCRESNLVKDIFSLLSVKSASDSVHRYVLKFTENLLDLAAENKDNSCNTGDEGNAARNVIITNLKALISNLRCYFYHNHGQKSKLVRHPGETVVRVLQLLSEYVMEHSTAEDFVEILLPIVQNGAKNSDVCTAALQVLAKVIPVLGDKKVGSITVNVVAPLLVTAEPDLRSSVCNLLSALAEIDASLLTTAELVQELNATSDMDIDDFDNGAKGYAKITPAYISGIAPDHAIVILSHCIHDMCSEELMLRNSAYNALMAFVKFLAHIIGQEVLSNQQISEQKMEVDGCHWSKACAQRFVNKFLLKHMGSAMNKESSVQKVWIDLLREMVCELSELPSLNSLKHLCSDNPEEDFFYNITHLQIRSRARAMTRFARVVATGKLSGDLTRRVFIPLFSGILLGLDDRKWEHVRAACLNAIASSSGQMSWKPYSELLSRCFRDMAKRPAKRKVLLRLICSVLDNFHFLETCAASDGKQQNDDVQSEVPVSPVRSSSVSDRAEVESFLQEIVLPKLQNLLASDSESMNIDVSLTALKVLKLLPAGILESQLPSIIQRIANFLKNRLESVRDGARSALAACLKELGVGYLRFIVKALRASLKRGFELHVLGYTLNFILSKCPPRSVGDLDYCLNDLLTIIENDILGDVAQEKDVEKIASKMKECRKRMSFETLELVAGNVTFQVHAKRLVSAVTAHMHTHVTPKMKSKLQNMLEHLATGIERNPSANPKDLFTFIYCLINDGIAGESVACGSASAISPKGKMAGDQNQKRSITYCAGDQPQGQHLVTAFALRLFHNRIKTGKLVKDDQLISFLDPFVNLFSVCLDSKHEEIITASLRCIFHLVKLPLPSLNSQADKIKITLLDIAQNSSNASSPIMETCLRLLTELLQSSKVTLSRDQLNMLIQFPVFVDLEKNPSFVLLSLLKAIVRRKLVVPKIYDLASIVAELMVTSQSGPIRNRCSQILLQFLMKYELSVERLEKHLNDLIVNVERYEHATGREAVLEMISAIIRKSPQEFADKWSWALFLVLINRLVHDPDSHVRSLVGAAIQLLVSRVGPASLDIILKSSFSWYLGVNEQLWSAAAQVLGLLVEVLKENFHKHISKLFLLPAKDGNIRMKSVLNSAIETSRQLNVTEQSAIPYWKEAYYSLVLFQKIVGFFPEFFFRKDVEYIWDAIIELLMHPHLWIRSIASRLMASCFEQTTKLMSEDKMQLGKTYHTRLDRLFTVAVSQCCHLKGKLSDDGAAEIAKNNLVFACWGIHMLRDSEESKAPCVFWSKLNSDEQRRFVEATQLLVGGKKRAIIASVMPNSQEPQIQGDENDHETGNKNDFCKLLVSCLLESMGKFAQQVENHQTRAFLSSFDLFASKIGLRSCELYAYELLHPLHRLCEGFSGKVTSEDVKHQAEEVLGRIRGMDNYAKVSSEIKRNRRTKSGARKQKLKVMAVVEPERRAKRKLRAAEKHKAHKKRKIMSMKMGRWMQR